MRWGEVASSSEPIAAVASPPGYSARGIVRISGAGALGVVRQRLTGGELPPRRSIRMVRVGASVGSLHIEVPCIALVMVAPASFTGQETVELLLAGSPVLLASIVEAMCDPVRGSPCARHATAGEFSARAFLSGKIALTEAESIAAAIGAESDAQLAAARTLGTSVVGAVAASAAEGVMAVLALVEAGIDFSDEEDVVAITPRDLADQVAAIDRALQEVVAHSLPEEVLRALPVIALRGATNAGKSSLFNAILGRQRSVESSTAGSTRDAIVEPLKLPSGREVLLVDLPGIEDPHGALAAQVQDLAHASLRAATMHLHCVPVDCWKGAPAGGGGITVVTKVDLAQATKQDQSGGVILTSARTGEGLGDLLVAIDRALGGDGLDHRLQAPVMLERHRGALALARGALARVGAAAQVCIESQSRSADPAELIANDLREALDALGTVAGTRTPDDVLGAVFARFCIGK